MGALFNLDNPVWRFMGKLVDVCILTLLWFACSAIWLPLAVGLMFGEAIPAVVLLISLVPFLILFGPSTTGVFYVTLKLVRDEESYTARSFFKSYKENFKQAAIIGAVIVAIGLFFVWDIYLYFHMGSRVMTILGILFIGIFLMYLFTLIYVFPLEARFYNTIRLMLRNALFMSIKHVFRSILMLIMLAVVVVGCLFFPPLIILSVGLVAFLQSYVLVRIFDIYTPKDETEHPLDEISSAQESEAALPGQEDVHIVMTRDDMGYGDRQILDRSTFTRTEPAVETPAIEEAAAAEGEAEPAAEEQGPEEGTETAGPGTEGEPETGESEPEEKPETAESEPGIGGSEKE